jgi:hypothetical protein
MPYLNPSDDDLDALTDIDYDIDVEPLEETFDDEVCLGCGQDIEYCECE